MTEVLGHITWDKKDYRWKRITLCREDDGRLRLEVGLYKGLEHEDESGDENWYEVQPNESRIISWKQEEE